MKLLVGSYPHQVIAAVGKDAYLQHFGMLCSPRDRKTPEKAVEIGAMWASDNFAFTDWRPVKFLKLLVDYRAYAKSCTFVAAPDVVRNAKATLIKFHAWSEIIHAYGYPVALVAQDGLENESIPWNDFEALFVGGSDVWKLGAVAAGVIAQAKLHGKWVHMGRVNSQRRLRYCQAIGCDSVDGSGYAKFTRTNTRKDLPILQFKQESLLKWA